MENLHEGLDGEADIMMEEARKVIAFVFQKKGKERMTEKEFYMVLSFEMGWLTPGEGMKIIEYALQHHLLEKEGDEIYPTFDYKSVEVPLGFKFDSKKMQELERGLIPRVMGKIMKEKKVGERNLRNEVRRLSEEMNIYPEIAVLLLAKKNGVEIEEFIEEAWELITGKG